MRAAAIVGLGNAAKSLARFQRVAGAEWITGLEDRADAVVICGGDGTVHRHLSAVIDLNLPVLVVPCGSGNDFARALGLRSVRDSVKAWRHFVETRKNVRTIDLGVVGDSGSQPADAGEAPAPRGSSSHRHSLHYFCCIAGVGLDAEITRRANNLPKWVRAHGGYAFCAPRQFFRFLPFSMKISCDDAAADQFQPTILAAVANTPTYGGGMRIAPHAQLDDGKLDVCIVRTMDTFKLFCLLPTVYFGRHLGFKEVEYTQAQELRIETEFPLDVYADGEYVCQTPVEFGTARNALKVIVPA
jgi:diacylglycerol kinase (ATP)